MSDRFLVDTFSGVFEEDAEFIPLMSQEDEDKINKEQTPDVLPILPLRNTVLFPGVVIPITVGRDKSIKLIKEAYKGNKVLGVVSQKDLSVEEPMLADLHTTGTLAHIMKMLRMPDGNITAIIQGRKLMQLNSMVQEEPYLKASIFPMDELKPEKNDEEFDALVSSIKDIALQIVKESPNIPSEAQLAIQNIESPSFLINFVCSNMDISVEQKQELLMQQDLKKRSVLTLELLSKELQKLEMKNEIQHKVKVDLDQQQREYFLNQQLKAIQEELGGLLVKKLMKCAKEPNKKNGLKRLVKTLIKS